MRRECASVILANILPILPGCDGSPPPSRRASGSRSAAIRWTWPSASPTRRRAHSVSLPATGGSATIASRTLGITKSEWSVSASTSLMRACVCGSTRSAIVR